MIVLEMAIRAAFPIVFHETNPLHINLKLIGLNVMAITWNKMTEICAATWY